MSRVVRQTLPDPPEAYSQEYVFRLVNALNLFMNQVTAPAEFVAARFISTDAPIVDATGLTPGSIPDTSSLATGTLYLTPNPNAPPAFLFSIVTGADL